MGLQVWLPLKGSLQNQGLAKITSISGTPSYKTPGKLGSNALDLKTRITFVCPALANLQTFSVAFWGLAGSSDTLTTNWQDLLGFYDVSSGGTSGTFRWETTYASSNGIHWHDNATNALVNGSHNHILVKDTWVHCCVVFDNINGKIYSYDNGVLTQTHDHLGGKFNTSGSFYLGETNNIEGMIQDVRFYDHALSSKEVEEISRGLVLHYKLDDPYLESTNILSCNITETAYNASSGKYGYNETSNLVKTIGYFQGKNCVKVGTITAGQSAKPYAYFGNLFTSDGTNSPAYKTLSFDYYTTVPTTTWLNIYKLGNGTGTAQWKTINTDGIFSGTYTNSSDSIRVKPNEWNHIEVVFHGTTAEDAQWGYCINGPTHTTSSDYYFLYANIQLEEKDHATGYGNSFHTDKVYDCSGYQNNGTVTGTATLESSSPRYSYGIYMNNSGTANRIESDTEIAIPETAMSVSFWTKFDKTKAMVIFADPKLEFAKNTSASVWLSKTSMKGFSLASFNTNEWNHIVAVRDGEAYRLYVNGVSVAQNASANNWSHNVTKLYLFNRNYNNSYAATASIVDFRVYATVLSEKQILELYKNSGGIDNMKNIYARELVEI